MSLTPQRAANLAENPHAGQGAVVLDIGEGVGAVIAHLPASYEGAEIEVELLGADQPTGFTDPAHDHDHPHAHEDEHAHGHDHGDHAHPHRPHVAVVGRPTPSGDVLHSAVFPSLPAGTYRLHEPESGESHDVVVTGATVTELDWAAPTSQ